MAFSPPGQSREQVYRFVRNRLLEGRPPSIREVQAAMGFRSVESARNHLQALVSEGRLVKDPGRARSLRLPSGSRQKHQAPPILVPLLGRVQAGNLNLALESPEGHVVVQTRFPPEDLFALRVKGESMKGAGILPDDVVVVRRQPTAENGEIVVALVETDATIKRLHRLNKHVELRPENPDFKPIRLDPDRVRILGKVIEVRRLYE